MLSRSKAAIVVLAALLLTISTSPGHAYPRPGTTTRLNLTFDGRESGTGANAVSCTTPNNSAVCSSHPVISANGRYVAFTSYASDLVPGDLNVSPDVFRRDIRTGKTELASVASDGSQFVAPATLLTAGTGDAAISDDGRFVAFTTDGENLTAIANDLNSANDAFVHDMESGKTVLASVALDGGNSNGTWSGNVSWVSLSGNGRFLAFSSDASNLVNGDTNGAADVFVRDVQKGVTERVSVGHDGSEANSASSSGLSISPTGRFIIFGSNASNLVPGDTNMQRDAFVFDRTTSETERISLQPDGSEVPIALGWATAVGSTTSSFSRDGRFVVFKSNAASLVPTDTGIASCDFFVRDRKTDRTERVSIASDGGEREGGCTADASITPDGRYVAINLSMPLADDDPPCTSPSTISTSKSGSNDVYVYDRRTGAAEMMSRASDGTPAARPDGLCSFTLGASISADGRYVTFSGDAPNLVPGDTNGFWDIFLHDRGGETLDKIPGHGDPGSSEDPPLICLPPPVGCRPQSRVVSAIDNPSDSDHLLSGTASQGELIGLSVAYRPQLGDLYLKVDVEEMAAVVYRAIDPLEYGFRLDVGKHRYEVRASSSSLLDATAARFDLLRCTSGICMPAAKLSGGFGTRGSSVVVAVPLAEVGLDHGGRIGRVEAFSAIGTALSGATQVLDRAEIGG